jgi:hypothetical protein
MGTERRRNELAAKSIDDALRARGTLPAAQALAYQNVPLYVAQRVLMMPDRRRPRCAR